MNLLIHLNRKCKLNILFLLFIPLALFGQVRLPKLISDGVVLQRDTDVKIWGWASPKEKVSVEFLGSLYQSSADEQGNWQVTLSDLKAGGPHTMKIKASNEITINDILIGDVWVCSGQSNMTIYMERVKEKYPDEVANANNPNIRHFFIPTLTDLNGPQKDLPSGEWKSANPEDIMRFSAVAYFFAKEIYKKYQIPIGLINSSVGGTPIKSWISEDGLKEFPELSKTIIQNKDTTYINQVSAPRPSVYGRKLADKGLLADVKWYDPQYKAKGWHNINIPGYWEDQGLRNLNGTVWYRREIEVPASMTGVEAKLFMGRIIDADYIYVNGTQVGNITYQYPPRRYVIPKDILKPGKNVIVVRVINYWNKGGFMPDKPCYLTTNGQDIDLKGTWQYKVGEVIKPGQFSGWSFSKQNQPASLFNAMVAPLTNHSVRGFLWYQGESDTGKPKPYRKLLPALINDWRDQWQNKALPFLYVQLHNYGDIDFLPTESGQAEIRDAQFAALSVENTAMAVAYDLGEWNDIHPLNKEDVGKRLALAALNKVYGEKDIVYSGPLYKAYKIKENKIIISFDHVAGGLISNDGEELRNFEIAGHDGRYVWADARIIDNTVQVSSNEIQRPASVRYAWADNPQDANLYNKEGLPASPFRTLYPGDANNSPWQGKKAAVVLTYDDAVDQQLDNAIPLLDSLNLKGTFYVTTFFDGFKNRIKEWQRAAIKGHELGNHTLFHPCDGTLPGREWVNENYDMSSYSLKRMIDEVNVSNVLLEALDGKKERTFAFTCGDMKIGDNYFFDQIKNDFIGARAVRSEMHKINQIDVYSIDSYMINGQSAAELIDLVKEAKESNALLVFLFHGVGGGHNLDVPLKAHRALLHYLKEHDDEIWTTTLFEAIKNIKQNQ